MQNDAIEGLADNVRRLKEKLQLSQEELARKAGLSQKAVSDLLNYGRTVSKSPKLSTVEKLAAAFGTTAWLLQIPAMPLDLLLNMRVAKLVENYRDAPERGRETVDRIAESEMRYDIMNKPSKAAG